MEKLKAWIQDKRNQPIAIGLGVGVLVIIIMIILIARRNAASVPAGPGANGMGPMGGPQAYGQGPLGRLQAYGQGSSGGPQAYGQGGSSAAGGPPVVMAQAAPAQTGFPMLPYRKDPFVPLRGPVTQKQILQSQLGGISHYQFPLPLKPITPILPVISNVEAGPEVLPAQPFRRMAGVMIDGRVSAIMETNGQSDIVTPGMELTRGNSHVRVDSISADEIVLKTLDTKRPMTIKVGLTGAVALPPPAQATGVQQGQGAGPIYPMQNREDRFNNN